MIETNYSVLFHINASFLNKFGYETTVSSTRRFDFAWKNFLQTNTFNKQTHNYLWIEIWITDKKKRKDDISYILNITDIVFFDIKTINMS